MIFGGHYYSGKETGYVYLNDIHVLDVNENRWIVKGIIIIRNLKLEESPQLLGITTLQSSREVGS